MTYPIISWLTVCGTPEVIQGKGYNQSADWFRFLASSYLGITDLREADRKTPILLKKQTRNTEKHNIQCSSSPRETFLLKPNLC